MKNNNEKDEIETGDEFENRYAEREYERLTGTPMSGKVTRRWIT